MSDWIKLHSSVFTHPKTRRLVKRLGISQAAAVGHLAALWTWTMEYAPDGDLSLLCAKCHGKESAARRWENHSLDSVCAWCGTTFLRDRDEAGGRAMSVGCANPCDDIERLKVCATCWHGSYGDCPDERNAEGDRLGRFCDPSRWRPYWSKP